MWRMGFHDVISMDFQIHWHASTAVTVVHELLLCPVGLDDLSQRQEEEQSRGRYHDHVEQEAFHGLLLTELR